jgi:hypothetical protein
MAPVRVEYDGSRGTYILLRNGDYEDSIDGKCDRAESPMEAASRMGAEDGDILIEVYKGQVTSWTVVHSLTLNKNERT